jgi:hypothetical protein
MAFIRRIKKNKSIYLAEVENYRDGGKVRQRVIRYIGTEERCHPLKGTKSRDKSTLSENPIK